MILCYYNIIKLYYTKMNDLIIKLYFDTMIFCPDKT